MAAADKGRRNGSPSKNASSRLMAFVTASARRTWCRHSPRSRPNVATDRGECSRRRLCNSSSRPWGPPRRSCLRRERCRRTSTTRWHSPSPRRRQPPRESSSPHTPTTTARQHTTMTTSARFSSFSMPHRRFKVGSFGFSNVRSIFQFHRTWRQSQSDPASIGPTLQARTFGENVWRCTCGGGRKVLVVVSSHRTAEEVLQRLGLLEHRKRLPPFHGPAPSLSL